MKLYLVAMCFYLVQVKFHRPSLNTKDIYPNIHIHTIECIVQYFYKFFHFHIKVCLGSISEMTRSAERILNETRTINGVSEQFVEDMHVILDKYQNESYVTLVLHEFVCEFHH